MLPGTTNHNEYYSQHYLLTLLENDLRDTFARWDEIAAEHPDSEAHRPPPVRLRALATPYFRLHNRIARLTDAAEKLEAERDWIGGFLDVMGYPFQPQWRTLGADGFRLPLLATVDRASGGPYLWILHAVTPPDEPDSDPLAAGILPAQYDGDPERDTSGGPADEVAEDHDWEEIITRRIFAEEEPPRWVLLVSVGQVCLIDRTKWPERRFLSFNLREILDRREVAALRATAALLHRENVCPEEGFALLDALDENSHRHAFSVSESLKDAMRESVELLGNEAVYYLREVRREGIFSEPTQEIADRLTRGCLHYLYRLLFILYLEARPELGYWSMIAPHSLVPFAAGNQIQKDVLQRLSLDEVREIRSREPFQSGKGRALDVILSALIPTDGLGALAADQGEELLVFGKPVRSDVAQ